MVNNLRKAIEIRTQARERQEAGINIYPSEEILGSLQKVREFAEFFTKNKTELEIVRAAFLMDYCEGVFTMEEKKAYQLGLDSFYRFFESSDLDIDSYLKEAEKENNKAKQKNG